MMKYVIASLISGILFGFLDGIINANPLAQQLFEVYKPIAATSVNIQLGFIIDLIYGFIMAYLFLLLYKSLPGKTRLLKGLSYGLIIWFFRVVMYSFSQYMMFEIPVNTLAYMLFTGLIEMLILGIFYGLLLKTSTE